MATVVLSAANLPLETIGYLYAIDRILDMMRTMTNVTGQMLVPVIVAKETGLLDQAVYDNPSSNVGVDDPDRHRHAAEVVEMKGPPRPAGLSLGDGRRAAGRGRSTPCVDGGVPTKVGSPPLRGPKAAAGQRLVSDGAVTPAGQRSTRRACMNLLPQ